MSNNPKTDFWTPEAATSPKVQYPFRDTGLLDGGAKIMKTESQTEIHCAGCGTDYTGAECPICAPLERIRLAARARRQLAALRRQCRRAYIELSQPPEHTHPTVT